MESFPFDLALKARIRENLARFERRSPDGDLTPAAVAFVLVPAERGEAAFVLTRRTRRLRNHGGQWAVPGGRLEQGETPVGAALRELREEVGLEVHPENVLGFLDDFLTRSGFRITPVVAWGPERVDLRPDPHEVEAAYRIPLRALHAPEVPRIVPGPEPERPLLTIPLGTPPTIVFAPTASMIFQFREAGLHGRPVRVDRFGEPRWAWS